MARERFLTIAEQVAEFLRGEILRGRWPGLLPGLPSLSGELGVNQKTRWRCGYWRRTACWCPRDPENGAASRSRWVMGGLAGSNWRSYRETLPT
jgi:hypothetical protein